LNTDQSIPWRTRPDLQSVEHAAPSAAAAVTFTVKDPIKDEFYFFSQLEFFFLKHLRCPQTFQSLIQAASTELGRKLGIKEIQNYLRHLARDNLIVPQKLGDGERLFHQHNFEKSGRLKQMAMGILSIRLTGFHPGALLPPMKPLGWLFFNPITLVMFMIALTTTTLFAVFSFNSLGAIVPGFAELITPGHLSLVLIGFVVAKVLHELGHALACQYTGHECSEMGVLLLVFIPCLYCDVSDMWTEKSRSKRILVSLAGVYVELGIAVICFWIWFLTVPGPLHNLCYSLMLITSVSTIFVNGNPLMRYDGYYALSDLVRIPNLASVARESLATSISQTFLRKENLVRENRLSRFLLTYASCSSVYRWLIMIAIGVGIWTFFDYQQLRSIGMIAVSTIAMLSLVPLMVGTKQSFSNIRKFGLHWCNALLCLGLIGGVLYGALGLEFSHRIWGQAEIQLSDPAYIFSTSNGKFITELEDGQMVTAGELIGTIENRELEMERITLSSELRDTKLNLESLEMRSDSHLLAGKVEFWNQRIITLNQQLEENETLRMRLEIRSPATGQVVAFKYQDAPAGSETLPKTTGDLFDEENVDCQISRGDPICYVGQNSRLRGFIAVDEKDIELVSAGQQVKLAIPFRKDPLLAEVVDVSIEKDDELFDASSQIADSSMIPDRQVTYRVEIEFDADPKVRVGSLLQAVIICQETNMTQFVGRWLRNSFWF
jgi:putative peptide zinc metalloprotease protein